MHTVVQLPGDFPVDFLYQFTGRLYGFFIALRCAGCHGLVVRHPDFVKLFQIGGVDGDEIDLRFYVMPDGRLSVSGVLVDTIIEIYSINGRQIYKGIAGDIPYLGQGLYLVKIGDETCKVII